jgi:Golgi phosphoprotein 3
MFNSWGFFLQKRLINDAKMKGKDHQNNFKDPKAIYDSPVPPYLKDYISSDPTYAKRSMPHLTLLEEIMILGLKNEKGRLSTWNDNISYVLRGLVLIELSFRDRIVLVDEGPKRPLMSRVVRVKNPSSTGEMILDETLKLISVDETQNVANWVDLLSGESWNIVNVHYYQLRRVRERIAKGLVDKGILCTSKTNFIFFDKVIHPIAAPHVKKELVQCIKNTLLGRGPAADRHQIALVCAAYVANVMEPVWMAMTPEERDQALDKAEELMKRYANFNEDVAKNSTEIMVAVIHIFATMDSFL